MLKSLFCKFVNFDKIMYVIKVNTKINTIRDNKQLKKIYKNKKIIKFQWKKKIPKKSNLTDYPKYTGQFNIQINLV